MKRALCIAGGMHCMLIVVSVAFSVSMLCTASLTAYAQKDYSLAAGFSALAFTLLVVVGTLAVVCVMLVMDFWGDRQ